MIFHDQQCNFHDYLMHYLQPPLFGASSTRSNSNVYKMLVDHAYILK